MITSSESSKDESEEEFSSSPRPVVTQNRLKTVKEKVSQQHFASMGLLSPEAAVSSIEE